MENSYKELYEKEHAKCNEYIARVAQLEEANAMLQFRLDRIHNNPIWKSTKGHSRHDVKGSKTAQAPQKSWRL